MASGGDPPQLPRGLIGRTGAPNAKGARLPSIRGPRDLTLGGVQKKVFVPNIPARRKQGESTVEQPSTSKDDKIGEGRGRGRGRGRGDRGRGRGNRGRGRDMNVIQTHSLFEQGPGGEKSIRRSGSEYTPTSGGVRGTSAGARSAPKISIKTVKTDEETKEVLDMLLKDDFVDIKADQDEDINEQPVKLPLEGIKAESAVKAETIDFTKVKVKEESMDTNEDVKPELPNVAETRSDALPAPIKSEDVTCADLFTKNGQSESGVLMFLQLPDTLPGLPVTTDDEFRGKKAEKREPDKENELSDKMKGCNLNNFSEGLVGKLLVRKSGRVQLQLGGTYLDVNMGTPCGFLQDLVSVKTEGNSGEATILGHVEHKLVCTPDFELLLDST